MGILFTLNRFPLVSSCVSKMGVKENVHSVIIAAKKKNNLALPTTKKKSALSTLSWCQLGSIHVVVCCHSLMHGKENYAKYLKLFSVANMEHGAWSILQEVCCHGLAPVKENESILSKFLF